MSLTPLLRWGILASFLIAALAIALRLHQQPLDAFPFFDFKSSPSDSAPGSDSGPRTYCYSGIRTQDRARPSARCFTVEGGKFVDVFTPEDRISSSSREVHELRSGYVIPGLWDGHGHLLQYGEFLHSVDLFGVQSVEEVTERVRDYVARNPGAGSKGSWVRGVGWDQTAFGRMPCADDLLADPALQGLYIMLDRIDVHCTWVSQPVLDLIPPEDLPEHIPGGEIIRDPGMGVFCDTAMDMVYGIWPQPGTEQKRAFIRTAMKKLNSVGLVGMHDAGAVPENLALFAQMADATHPTRIQEEDGVEKKLQTSPTAQEGPDAIEMGDDWSLRIYAMLECPQRNTFCADKVEKLNRKDGFLTVRSVKLFADGALGSWGSAMIDPYDDHPDTKGSLLINASALADVTRQWAAAGFQVNIHAIGDLANRYAIDAMEGALQHICPSALSSESSSSLKDCQELDHRFRIEHAQIIHPVDQQRIASLALIPSIQPTHATSDMKYAEARLGLARTASSAYRMRSLLEDLNIRLILGSDFPVEPPDPFQGIYAAVARKSPHTGLGKNGSEDGWYMDEALSLDEALDGFTTGPAYGAFMEGKAGVITEGAFADWLVLEEPIEEMELEALRGVEVRETWVGGRRVFARE